eukprot:scaffold4424_cov113-Isochrysis_galbana.AAC.8
MLGASDPRHSVPGQAAEMPHPVSQPFRHLGRDARPGQAAIAQPQVARGSEGAPREQQQPILTRQQTDSRVLAHPGRDGQHVVESAARLRAEPRAAFRPRLGRPRKWPQGLPDDGPNWLQRGHLLVHPFWAEQAKGSQGDVLRRCAGVRGQSVLDLEHRVVQTVRVGHVAHTPAGLKPKGRGKQRWDRMIQKGGGRRDGIYWCSLRPKGRGKQRWDRLIQKGGERRNGIYLPHTKGGRAQRRDIFGAAWYQRGRSAETGYIWCSEAPHALPGATGHSSHTWCHEGMLWGGPGGARRGGAALRAPGGAVVVSHQPIALRSGEDTYSRFFCRRVLASRRNRRGHRSRATSQLLARRRAQCIRGQGGVPCPVVGCTRRKGGGRESRRSRPSDGRFACRRDSDSRSSSKCGAVVVVHDSGGSRGDAP